MTKNVILIGGKAYIKSQVVMLPAKKATKVGLNPTRLSDNKLYYFEQGVVAYESQHLYFLSDEEIEELP